MLEVRPNNSHIFSKVILTFDEKPTVTVQPGKYIIRDKNNTLISEGLLLLGDAVSEYQFVWNVPGTEINNPYTVQWLVPTESTLIDTTTFFEIEEDIPEDFTHSTLLTEGFSNIPVEIPVEGKYRYTITDTTSRDLVSSVTSFDAPGKQILKLNTKVASGQYLLILKNLSTANEYIINLSVAPKRFWLLLARLRTYIDREKLPFTDILALQNEHAYTYFEEGISKINRTGNLTNYTWVTYPTPPLDYGMEGLLIQSAAYYALRSLYLLENRLAFDYNGPNISVTHDKLSGLDTELERMRNELEEATIEAKRLIWSRGPTAALAHRRIGARSYSKRRSRFY